MMNLERRRPERFSQLELITPEKFEILLPSICDKETARVPNEWTADNPLIGHCAVVSTVAYDLFGGKLLQASLKEIPEFAYLRSHFVNRLPNGEVKDFTGSQFGDNYPEDLNFIERTRDEILCYPDTLRRYNLLAQRLKEMIYEI